MRTSRFFRVLVYFGKFIPEWFASKSEYGEQLLQRVSVCWFRKTIEPAPFSRFQRKIQGGSPERRSDDQ